MKTVLDKLFHYDNYREFLRDYFQEQKSRRKTFSHRYFAQKAGFKSSSFALHVMEGKRNLSGDTLSRMIRGLGMKEKPAGYFAALVQFNQAKGHETRMKYLREVERLRKQSTVYKVDAKQFAYYEEWYYPVIRELAVYATWNEDYAALGHTLVPPITPEKARQAVELLHDIGLLQRKRGKLLKQSAKTLTTQGVPQALYRKARREMILHGLAALDNMGPELRHASGVTVAMSEKTQREACRMIDDLRRRILEMAAEDEGAERIYQFNFQAFPFTRNFGKNRPQKRSSGHGE